MSWRSAVAVLGLLVGGLAPGAALAQSGNIKLALLPVGQPGSFFDLTIEPGDARTLAVLIANDGDLALAARTYASDVYTIIDGGFGARLRGEPQTGPTLWLDYPTEVLQLAAGHSNRQSFSVSVPIGTEPGEYITSLVLENDRPIAEAGSLGLDQVVRQAVAVVVTVPGRRSPALSIGGATEHDLSGRSVVSVAVANPGNVRLKPVVEFTLLDSAARQVSHARVPMDTFYAHTDTTVELPLAARLLAGAYTVRVTLDDAAQGAVAEATIPFVVEPGADVATTAAGAVPALIQVDQTPVDGGGGPASPVNLAAILGLATLIPVAGVGLARRRARRGRIPAA